MSWIPLPYNVWFNRIQRFLYDVVDPYLRLFRRFLPSSRSAGSGSISRRSSRSSRSSSCRLCAGGNRRAPHEEGGCDVTHARRDSPRQASAAAWAATSGRRTDDLLVRIAESFEDVWRERADLRDEVERLEGELARFQELEVLLRNTLVSAERAADELRAQAHREADVILEEARLKAREIGGGAESERERVRADIRRLKTSRHRCAPSTARSSRPPSIGSRATPRSARRQDKPPSADRGSLPRGYTRTVSPARSRLRPHVSPGGRETRVHGGHGDGWKVWVASRPEAAR